jgi:hypothetical protein
VKTTPTDRLLQFLYLGLPGASVPGPGGGAAAYGYVLSLAATNLEALKGNEEARIAAAFCR